ncbi:MAG TPA: type II 3-dehydroquinate dehydratase [Candidatus Nanopelagicaceae bacterium]
MKVLVINGPNLSRLDLREKNIYGNFTYDELSKEISKTAGELSLDVEVRQSDDEATIIGWLHEASDKNLAVIINPAAFTHYSYAIRDALAMVATPKIEVHLSNPLGREEFRHTSVASGVVNGTIAGFGIDSYRLALRALIGISSK